MKAEDRSEELDSYFDKGDSQGDKKKRQHSDQDCAAGIDQGWSAIVFDSGMIRSDHLALGID